MSAYKQQELDFVLRTVKILSQYEDYFKRKNKKEKFEVTLMINSFVGLLIFPQQKWIEHFPESIISKKDWGIDASHIGFIRNKSDSEVTIKAVVTHLRNSVAHCNFSIFENSKNEISQIHFLDFKDKEREIKTFEATVPVSCLRKFILKFSQIMIEKIREYEKTQFE